MRYEPQRPAFWQCPPRHRLLKVKQPSPRPYALRAPRPTPRAAVYGGMDGNGNRVVGRRSQWFNEQGQESALDELCFGANVSTLPRYGVYRWRV